MRIKQLQKELAERKGARIISLVTVTEVFLKPEGKEKFGKVFKLSHINGIVNFNYENSVNKQREREGVTPDFVAQPRKWGTKLEGMPFISHVRKTDGAHELYLEIKIENIIDVAYRSQDGKVISDGDLWQYIRKTSTNLGHQKITKEVILRDININNIILIIIDGKVHLITLGESEKTEKENKNE